MDRVLRTILQRSVLIRLFLFMSLPIVIGGVLVYRLPREYQATATLWALHRYDTLTATTVDYSNLATPAETQVTALNELLNTRSFALGVAQEANLANTLSAQTRENSTSRDDALVANISQNVQVVAQGYDIFTITYTGSDPQIVQQVVKAVVDHYHQEVQLVLATEGQNLVGTYQTQLLQAQQTAQSAAATESSYIQSHPHLTGDALQRDSVYQLLHAQTQQAQLNVQNIQTDLNTLEQEIATHTTIAASLYRVVSIPPVPDQPVPRRKNLLLGLAGGLAIGLMASILFIALLLRWDRKVYTSSDLRKLTTYPIVMELPLLSPKAVEMLVKTSSHAEKSAANNGRS